MPYDDGQMRHPLIPTALDIDLCPTARCDGSDSTWSCDELPPGFAACGDDGVVAVADDPAEEIAAEVFPDVLGWIEFGRVGRQFEQANVVRYDEAGGDVPTGAIDDQDRHKRPWKRIG